MSCFPVLLKCRHRKAANLSGGQQAATGYCARLAADPKVLLLDRGPLEGIQPFDHQGKLATTLNEI